MRQNPCDPACMVTCNFGADDVKSRLSGGFVRMFETRARKRWQLALFCWQCKNLVMTHQARAVPEGVKSSCQDAREFICDGGGGASGAVHYKCGHIRLLVTVMTRSVVQGIWQWYSDSAVERVCTRRLWGAAWQQTRHHHFLGSPCFSLTWAETCRGPNSTR